MMSRIGCPRYILEINQRCLKKNSGKSLEKYYVYLIIKKISNMTLIQWMYPEAQKRSNARGTFLLRINF